MNEYEKRKMEEQVTANGFLAVLPFLAIILGLIVAVMILLVLELVSRC